jgi:hypothetical protein
VRTHRAIPVAHGELAAEVDVELAPLILEAWRAGIPTIHSCQDVGENVASLAERLPHLGEVAEREAGRASIGFPTTEVLVSFLDAVANAGRRDELYERMVHWATPGAWLVVVAFLDRGLSGEGAAPSLDGTPISTLEAASFQVHLPRSDVGEVTERLRRHNRGERVALGRPSWAAITVEDD